MTLQATIARTMGRFWIDERGAALVEFAMILPILLLFFAVTIEGGRMMWSYQSAASGVRDASRFIARSAPADICTSGASLDGFIGDIEAIVSGAISGTTIYPAGVTINAVVPTLTCITGTYRNSPVGVIRVTATITVDFPFGAIFGYASGAARSGFTATLSDEQRVFGA